MDDADANNGAVWTKITLDATQCGEQGMEAYIWQQIENNPLLASADSKEVEVLQEGKCLCGQPLAGETVILSNSGGNLAVMCSGECFDEFMMLGMLQQIANEIGTRVKARGEEDESEEVEDGYSD